MFMRSAAVLLFSLHLVQLGLPFSYEKSIQEFTTVSYYNNADAYYDSKEGDNLLFDAPCPALSDIKHGKIRCIPGYCRIYCDEGFTLEGNHELFCENGKWNHPVPVCVGTGCSKPDNPQHGTVACDDAKTTCTYTCDAGYKLTGSSEIHCSNGEWSNNDVICVADVGCHKPENPQHGTVACDEAKTTCNYTCDAGYKLNGPAQIHCSNGEWSKNDVLCVPEIGCLPPDKPQHGTVACDEAKTTCTYRCDAGYMLSSSPQIYCRNGQWDRNAPTCLAVDPPCPDIINIEHGVAKCTPLYCRIYCHEGFSLKGEHKLLCENGTWDHPVPECIESKLCRKLNKPVHGDWEGSCENATIGERCKFKCYEGYEVQGKEELWCSNILQWTAGEPCCIKKEEEHCPKLHKPEKGYTEGSCENATQGYSCTFKCIDGYILQGKEELFCSKDLKWNGVEPHCVKKEEELCPKLHKPEKGDWEGFCENATPGQSCIFKCMDGYILQGQEELVCSNDLKWNGVEPRCDKEEEHCPKLHKPDKGDWEGSCEDATPGHSCIFKCMDGYILQGQEELICSKDLKWNGVEPRCFKEEEHCPKLHKPDKGDWEGSCENATPGHSCIFECMDGYILQGQEELVCSKDLKWDGVEPRCVKEEAETCPKLKKPEKGDWEGSCENATRGYSCRFKCNDGYVLQGKGELFCSNTLKWNGVEPSCVENQSEFCPKLQKPENGNWEGRCENARKGQLCTFMCNNGYILQGKEVLFCSSTLKWDGEEPSCVKTEAETCPKLKKPEKGDWEGSCENATPGYLCRFKCNDGYVLQGKGELFCSNALKWNGVEPSCVEKQPEFCPKLQKPENGNWEGPCENAAKGQSCIFTCNNGYILQGNEQLFCDTTLKWNGEVPRCVKNESEFCPKLQKPGNGNWEGHCENARKGQLCMFSCNNGYALHGKEKLFCTSTLKWNGVEPRCLKNESEFCPELQKPENGNWEGPCENAAKGQSCTFTCNNGYILQGKEQLFCDTTLKWNGEVPRCVKNESEFCPKLQKPENGNWEGPCENARKGQLCMFMCNNGYTLQGKKQLFCSNKLKWSGVEPRCLKNEFCPKLQKPENGDWEGDCENARKGQFCRFRCTDGYKLQGEEELFCRSTLKWNGEEPRCVKTHRPRPHASDCATIKRNDPESKDGVYRIYLQRLRKSIDVFCDMTTDDGGWTVFQRRTQSDREENFFLSWVDYKTGFGTNLTDQFWLGNENIHAITEHEPQVLRVDLEDFEERKVFAKYLRFSISDETDDYKLIAGQYSGNAGDSLFYHNNCRFTTKDHGYNGTEKAAQIFSGGWWYNNLVLSHYSNLNGLNLKGNHLTLGDGINWYTFHGWYYSLKKSEMKMRPRVY